jgi:uncharacterized protein YciI
MKKRIAFVCCTLWAFSAMAQRTEGMVFVFLTTNPYRKELPKAQVDSLQAGHMANIQRLAREGSLLAAGPFEGGGGLFVMNTTSIDQTDQWLATDPAVAANRYRLERMPFTVQTGAICTAHEPFELSTFTFIRFNPEYNKFNVRVADELWRQHLDFLKEVSATGNVLLEGHFGPTEGGILIMQGEVDAAVFQMDPAVKDGFLIPEIKKLWIGKGALCEE